MAIYREREKLNRKCPKYKIKLSPINRHMSNENPNIKLNIKKDFYRYDGFSGYMLRFLSKKFRSCLRFQ